MKLNSDNRWYALRIRPRFEKLAATHLRDKGYEEYLPLFKSRRRWSDRTKVVELPLFPGYAFCRFDVRNRLPVLVAPGVLSIVGVGKIPASIPEAEICSIQKAVASGLHCEPWSSVPIGHRVSVKRGPLEGLSGTLIEVKSNFRLILSLPLLQRSVAVEIDGDCVETSSWQPADRSTETRNSVRTAGSSL